MHLAEKSLDARFIKWVDAAFVEDDLFVVAQHISRQISAAVGWKTYPVGQQGVVHLFLSFGAVDAALERVLAIAVVRIDISDGNNRNLSASGPGHNAADVCQDPPVVSDAVLAGSKKEILLSIDVNQDLPAPCSDQL
jgi:hypothetical protein